MSLQRIPPASAAPRADVHYTCGAAGVALGGSEEFGHDKIGEEEVADMVGGKMGFDAVRGDGALGELHYAGAVYEDVNGRYITP